MVETRIALSGISSNPHPEDNGISGNPHPKDNQNLSGHTILIDDTANGEHIQMVTASGAAITLDESGISLEMGDTKMLISATGVTVNGKALRKRIINSRHF